MIGMEAFLKAIGWLIIGIFAGLSSLLLILVSSAIFTNSETGIVNLSLTLADNNVITFLCIALLFGAAADFLFCSKYHKGWRLCAFLAILCLFTFVCYALNPRLNPVQSFVHGMVIAYIIITVGFCIGVKTAIFYQELLSEPKTLKK